MLHEQGHFLRFFCQKSSRNKVLSQVTTLSEDKHQVLTVLTMILNNALSKKDFITI